MVTQPQDTVMETQIQETPQVIQPTQQPNIQPEIHQPTITPIMESIAQPTQPTLQQEEAQIDTQQLINIQPPLFNNR